MLFCASVQTGRLQNGFCALLAMIMLTTVAGLSAQVITVELDDFRLLPANTTQNTLDVTLSGDGFLGSSRDTSVLSGFMTALLDLNLSTGSPSAVGLTFTGGQLSAEDMSFSLAGGLLRAQSSNIAGSPFTEVPPGSIVNGVFDAADHGVLLDQGSITATGYALNLSDEPIAALGMGQGQFSIMPAGMTESGQQSYTARLTLPLELMTSTDITGIPIIGTATVDLAGAGTIVAEQSFVLEGIEGDYDFSGTLDCMDLDLLSAAINATTHDIRYDADGNGILNSEDTRYWVESIRQTIPGDANLDGRVTSADLTALSDHMYSSELSWCHGDFNYDGLIDGSDFNVWNQHKGLVAPASDAAAVPEPQSILLALGALGLLISRSRA
jgi:hypothetical protein